MIKGVTEKEERIIKSILSNYPYEFFYYGSRVKGDYTKSSDLDILIRGKTPISLDEKEKLEIEFNKSLIPYIVNFSDFHKISNEFYELIKDSLVNVF